MTNISVKNSGTMPRSRARDLARATRLRGLLHECGGSSPAQEADRLREALIELGGGGTDRLHGLNVAAIHGRIDSGAGMDAVLEIMGRDVRFMLSRGAQGNCLASVISADDEGDEALAQGATPALALLGAYICAMLARLERDMPLTNSAFAPVSARLH